MDKIKNLEYQKNKLVNFFVEYHNCKNQKYVNFEQKKKRDLFNVTIRPRMNYSSLVVQNSVFNSRNTDFGSEIGFGIGVETEFILPFNKNKWSIIIEPTYQNFKAEKTSNVNNVSGGVLISNINYSSIEIPIGLRHYFFLNNNSKIFINASYIFDLSSKSSIEFTRSNGSSLDLLEIETGSNIAMGIGYKHKDKYSVEVRLQTNRDILRNYTFWSSEYKTLSIIMGYSIF